MGWINVDAPEHEGYVAHLLDDGRETDGSTLDGVTKWSPTEADRAAGYQISTYDSGAEQVVIPWERVALWRIQCSCGWTGGMRPAQPTNPDGSRDCPADLEDDVFLPQWQAHVAPYTALHDLTEAAAQRRSLDQRIDQLVALARTAGVSWSQIGAVFGITKQRAQQRWGTFIHDPSDQRPTWWWTPGQEPQPIQRQGKH